MKRASRHSAQVGFTLIELLVVIAIIAILAAILFPVFARARDKANAASCLSNIKQVGLACLMYIQDFDEFLLFTGYFFPDPSGAFITSPRGYAYWRWHEVIIPYLRNDDILKCESYRFNPGRDPNSYGYNGYALGLYSYCAYSGNCTRRTYIGNKLGEVARPAQLIMLGPRYCLAGDSLMRALTYYYCQPQVHNNGDNYAFCDGHAKWMTFGGPMVPTHSGGPYYTYWSW